MTAYGRNKAECIEKFDSWESFWKGETMNKDLIIEIPKKYEKEIRERWDLNRVEDTTSYGVKTITGNCPLCVEFYYPRGTAGEWECDMECPFAEKLNIRKLACYKWFDSILTSSERSSFVCGYNRTIIYNMGLFKQAEKKLE